MTPGELTRIGYDYNRPAPLDVPFKVEGDVVITAWKPSEDGAAWVLRVQEAGGKGTGVRLRFREAREVTRANLLEEACATGKRGTRYATRLHKHGILTLLIR